jgi:tRNA modification GTPase
MTELLNDTIAAVATPPGRGGVGIVRLSGPASADIARRVLGGNLPRPRYAGFARFRDANGETIDEGIALYFPAPHSFTGEEVIELHGHGGPVVMDMLLQALVEMGARLARPGEFSERAFLNDKLDLAQAEAIADLIDASSRRAARSATRSLQGAFSTAVNELVEVVIELRIYVEAAIDFPDEEIDFLSEGNIHQRLDNLSTRLEVLTAQARQGQLLQEGMHIVLAGPPNAGKSSLLNQLAQRDTAIVTAVPGTTRDVLREQIHLDGMPLHVVDTAGLHQTEDLVEQEGMRRTWQAIAGADRVLLVVDASEPDPERSAYIIKQLPARLAVTYVYNKVDLTGQEPGYREHEGKICVFVSARTGAGLDALKQHLKDSMGYESLGEGLFVARRRHLQALARAQDHLSQAGKCAEQQQGELVAEELRQVQDALGEITGQFTSDDLLGRIFSSFCIGK